MSLLTGDSDKYNTSLRTEIGGNGDYYIQIWNVDKDGIRTNLNVRVPVSGGKATHEVKKAIADLHWAMEDANLNQLPD